MICEDRRLRVEGHARGPRGSWGTARTTYRKLRHLVCAVGGVVVGGAEVSGGPARAVALSDALTPALQGYHPLVALRRVRGGAVVVCPLAATHTRNTRY
jgi:hypothetical protein